MTVPEDAEKVVTAIRLGWIIAEVRGRNRPDAPPGAKTDLPAAPGKALPLKVEQTSTELRIEAQSVLGVMAHDLRLDRGKDHTDFPAAIDGQAKRLYQARQAAAGAAANGGGGAVEAPPSAAAPGGLAAPGGGQPGGPVASGVAEPDGAAVPDGPAVPGGTAVLEALASEAFAPEAFAPEALAPEAPAQEALTPETLTPETLTPGTLAPGTLAPGTLAPGTVPTGAPGLRDPDAQWLALQELIFKFDAHIQDTMASGPDTIAAGYQLGRALAEPYWALAPALPDKTPSPQAWWFLLGPERCGEMSRLAGRLTAYFHPFTAAAIAGSVQIWKHVAADPNWRKNADDELYLQTRRWYELVVMKQDPTTLLQPYALIRNFRMMRRALRIFWPELSGTAIAAAALSGFAVLLGQHHINSFFKSALGFIAITGFSAAGLTARLKNQAQAMVTRLRQDVYTDLVAVAITTAPPVPGVPARRQGAKLAEIARERSITPVTPS